MRLRTLSILFLLGACAESSRVDFGNDAGPTVDASSESSIACGMAGQPCCDEQCKSPLICTGGVCGTDMSLDGGDAACPFVVCEGVCTDVESDARNCGLCRHDCQGTSCSNGLCLARGIAVGTSPVELVVGTGNVYFTDVSGTGGSGTVKKVPSGGGTVDILATAIAGPYGIAADASSVYFTSEGTEAAGFMDGAVLKVPINPDGGGPITPISLVTARPQPQSIVVDSSNVYWFEPGSMGSGGALLSCPLDGCPANVPKVLAGSLATPYAIALDATSIYVTSPGGGTVLGIDKATGAIRVIALMQNQPEGIAVANGMVYWATNTDGLVQAAPISGDGGTSFIATTMGSPQSVAADAVNVYWSDVAPMFTFGPVESCSVKGCPPKNPVKLVGTEETATNIAIDALFVYWIDDSGQILRVAK